MVNLRTNVERERERESTYANLFIVGYGSKEKLWQHAGGNQNTGTGVCLVYYVPRHLDGLRASVVREFFPLQTPTLAAAETDRYSSVLRSVFSHSDDGARRRLSVTRSCPVRANIAAATAPCFA